MGLMPRVGIAVAVEVVTEDDPMLLSVELPTPVKAILSAKLEDLIEYDERVVVDDESNVELKATLADAELEAAALPSEEILVGADEDEKASVEKLI